MKPSLPSSVRNRSVIRKPDSAFGSTGKGCDLNSAIQEQRVHRDKASSPPGCESSVNQRFTSNAVRSLPSGIATFPGGSGLQRVATSRIADVRIPYGRPEYSIDCQQGPSS